MDHQVTDLIFVSMKQDRFTVPTDVIDCVIAGSKDRRRRHHRAKRRRPDYAKLYSLTFRPHDTPV